MNEHDRAILWKHDVRPSGDKEIPGGSEYGLLMLAGVLRDSMPWVSEVLVEAQRELKGATPKQARKVVHDLRRALKFMTQSHFAEMMMEDSKHSHMMMEMPHMIERMLIDRVEGRFIGDQEVENDVVPDEN